MMATKELEAVVRRGFVDCVDRGSGQPQSYGRRASTLYRGGTIGLCICSGEEL